MNYRLLEWGGGGDVKFYNFNEGQRVIPCTELKYLSCTSLPPALGLCTFLPLYTKFWGNIYQSFAVPAVVGSVPDPGSGVFLTPGSGMEKIRILDPGYGKKQPLS